MPLNMQHPQKIINNIVYANNMPSIYSSHVSITKITTIKKTGTSTGNGVYTVYVYNDTAMFYYDHKFVKFNMKTQTSTIITFSASINGDIYLSPDLSGIYTMDKSGNYYYMTYFSFKDGSMTQLNDSDQISAIYPIFKTSFQSAFIGDNYIIYPKHGRMYTDQNNTCKIYMCTSSSNSLYPSITEIASINIGTTSYDRYEIVNMNITEFKNNKLRYTLLITSAYNLFFQPSGFYNEYDITTKKFWISDKTGLGSPISIKYDSHRLYSEVNGDPVFNSVPFIYVDANHNVAIPTLAGGTTVLTVPQRDAGYRSSTDWADEDDSKTIIIFERANPSYNDIMWGV